VEINMRVAYGLLAAGALIIAAAGPASAGCYGACVGYVAPPHHVEVYERPYHRSHHWLHHHKRYRHRPLLVIGDAAHSYMGPVYASTGQYYYGPYVSHRANFGYGGCRTAYLAYGPAWQLASNC
jgi:hypothetical protein